MTGRRCLCSSPLSEATTETMTFGDTTGWYDGTETLKNGGSLTIFD
ncbi:MAG: hypothetical protein KBT32_11605 [Bacteroidales bacterium]|nr:hypothetical protein [Candidatus Physcocola equi]